MKRVLTILFAGSLLLLPAACGGETATTDVAAKQQKIGVPFKTEEFQTTIVSAKVRKSVGSEFFVAKPAEGGEYVAVVWKYKNITKEPIGMFSTPSLKLVDPSGVEYDADVNASSSYATERNLTEKIVSDLNPGITVTGAAVFEVAKGSFNAAKWMVLVDADENVTVSLK